MSHQARERVIYRRFVRIVTRGESRVPQSHSPTRCANQLELNLGLDQQNTAERSLLTGQASSTSAVDPRSPGARRLRGHPLRPVLSGHRPETGAAASDQIHRVSWRILSTYRICEHKAIRRVQLCPIRRLRARRLDPPRLLDSLVPALSNSEGGIVNQRAKRAEARFARVRLTRWSGTMRFIACGACRQGLNKLQAGS